MITLYAFGRVFRPVIGETRDLRVQWALEEMELPYRVHALDHSGGEFQRSPFSEISPFRLAPVIDDDGFMVAESGAILLYLAEKYGRLIPGDFSGRIQVMQWCFSALNTVEWSTMEILLIDKFGDAKDADRRTEKVKQAARELASLERRLAGREWVASSAFSVADILLTAVLREIRKTNLLEAYPQLKAYFERAQSRPAWQRTLKLYSERLGVTVAEIV